MEEQSSRLDTFLNDTRDYFNARQELIKLQVTEKVAGVFSHIISLFIILPFFLLAFLFISISLAHLFAEWWGHEYAGYLTVTAMYTVTGLLLVRFRKSWLVRPLMNLIIKTILSR